MLTTILIDCSLALKNQPGYTKLIHQLHSNSISVYFISHLEDLDEIITSSQLSIKHTLLLTDTELGCRRGKQFHLTTIAILHDGNQKEDLFSASCLLECLTDATPSFLEQELLHANQLPVTILTTPRTIVKELTTDDIPALFALYDEKEVKQYLPPLSSLEEEIEKHQAYIQTVYCFYRLGLWGIFERETGTLIGRMGLEPIELEGDSAIELGYLLAKKEQRKGYAKEVLPRILQYAKQELFIDSLVARIHPNNKPSIQLANKLGFRYVKTISFQNETFYLYELKM